MDQPNLDQERHLQALRGLTRINAWSGSVRLLWPALRQLARASARPLRVLDLATGAGDVPLRLWCKAQRAKVPLEIAGCDISTTALDHARTRAEWAGADLSFFQADVLNPPLPEGYDVLTCSLFLHHLEEEQAVALLRRAAAAARKLVLINDLRRGRLAWLTAWVATRVLTTSPVVHTDGPLSVAAAFTIPEALELARRAGLAGTTAVPRWPFRFLLTWQR
jgi:2-polyprenyl-3-methyl-5-hydroxy-6-metoxy-1,4-benzoquinol methylase